MSTAALSITGMTCASCVAHVSKSARSVPGVVNCSVNLARGRATIEFDPTQTSADQIAGQITSSGYAAEVEQTGIDREAKHNHHRKEESARWLRRAIVGLVLWFPVEFFHWVLQIFAPRAHAAHMGLIWIALLTSTLCLFYVGSSFYKSAWTALLHRTTNMDTLIAMGASVAYFYSLIYFLGGQLRLWPAPMGDELYFMESSALLALISLGHWLEANARRSADSAIRELLNLAPAVALRLVEDGKLKIEDRGSKIEESGSKPANSPLAILNPPSSILDPQPAILNPPASSLELQTEQVPVSAINRQDKLLIRPGDRVPVDGRVIDGNSSVDESMITGEPLPVTRTIGEKVMAGTLNVDGRLIIRATAVGADTALSHIVALVEKAQDSRPPVQKLADQISAVFVPVVLCIALLTGVGWYAWGISQHWSTAIVLSQVAKTTCSVLLIACPCALGLAVPAAIMVGTGSGARKGILIRDIDALQNAEKIDTVVLDKTGTITEGKPVVTGVTGNDIDAGQVLRLAAAAEQFSAHPLAKAIVGEAKNRGIAIQQPAHFTDHPGYGVVAELEGRILIVGNQAMLDRHNAMETAAPQARLGGGPEGRAVGADAENPARRPATKRGLEREKPVGNTVVYVAEKLPHRVKLLGQIEIADSIKTDSKTAIARLRGMGLKLVMLTGDNITAAAAIARQVEITQIHADVRPDQKAAVIQLLQTNQKVAMVGDGINDAPALATANLGIALGSGSDVAKETGDIVLVGGSLTGVAGAIILSRATMRIIRQNLFLAFIYNVLAIPLAAMGVMHPVVAAAAMALSDVTVLGNSLRLHWVRISA